MLGPTVIFMVCGKTAKKHSENIKNRQLQLAVFLNSYYYVILSAIFIAGPILDEMTKFFK